MNLAANERERRESRIDPIEVEKSQESCATVR
jgi:hypothetical protein